MDNNVKQIDFNTSNNESEKYKVETIWDSVIYAQESKLGHHLPKLYYLVSCKTYLKEKNTWEPALAIQHLSKLISLFYKNHLDKLTVIFEAIETTPLMARPTVKSMAIKQK